MKLIIVGDQLSRKSSLLKALTRLAFPIASNLYIQFTTQIILY
jgi:hypothetical protein